MDVEGVGLFVSFGGGAVLRLGLAVWCELAVRGFPETEGAIFGNRLSVRTANGTEERFPKTKPTLGGGFKDRFHCRQWIGYGIDFPKPGNGVMGENMVTKAHFSAGGASLLKQTEQGRNAERGLWEKTGR